MPDFLGLKKAILARQMYRLAWNTLGGKKSHGDYYMTLQEAKALLEKMRRAFPLMNHWIEREYDASLVWGINGEHFGAKQN